MLLRRDILSPSHFRERRTRWPLVSPEPLKYAPLRNLYVTSSTLMDSQYRGNHEFRCKRVGALTWIKNRTEAHHHTPRD